MWVLVRGVVVGRWDKERRVLNGKRKGGWCVCEMGDVDRMQMGWRALVGWSVCTKKVKCI